MPGDLSLGLFELASEIRLLDTQPLPYDLSSLGEKAVAIETRKARRSASLGSGTSLSAPLLYEVG